MQRIIHCLLVISCLVVSAHAQDRDGPTLPIILDHADSIVGSGPIESGIREFVGHVRFTQGNVTVECDRALHNVSANSVELFSNVKIQQQGLVLTAPYVTYSGTTHIALAPRGVVVREKASTIQARHGTYSTVTHVVVFRDSVIARDSAMLWADTLVYDRDSDTTLARGNVLIIDTLQRLVTRSQYAFRDPNRHIMRLERDAHVWQWSTSDTTATMPDTLYLAADYIDSRRTERGTVYHATSRVHMTRGEVAARCDSLVADRTGGSTEFYGTPVVWSDSMQLHADTIVALAENDELRSIVGRGAAILVAQTDSLRPERVDQIAGARVTLSVRQDTIRQLEALGDAQSITFRSEEQRGDGLAKVASDTIRVLFDRGQLTDVIWLGGVEGEHHPEPVVAGRAETYRLPQFRWRTDRPFSLPVPRAPSIRSKK